MKKLLRYTILLILLVLPIQVFAADLEITCYENEKPYISKSTGYLFDLNNFVPGESAIRTLKVENTDPNNNCKIYFKGVGSSNTLTENIYIAIENIFGNIVDKTATSNKTLTQFLNEDRVQVANLNPGQSIQRELILTFNPLANNDNQNSNTSFDIRVISEWGNEVTEEENNEEVLGSGDRKNIAQTSSIKGSSEELGVGGPEESEIKGEQTCDVKSKLYGYIYLDRNSNDTRDERETVFENISLKIYQNIEGEQITTVDLTTDDQGYWETYICPGEYFIEINRTTLPENIDTEDNITEVVLAANVDELEIDIPVYDTRNFLEKYWPWIVLGVLALGLIGTVIMGNRRRKVTY